jgi:hypothetical protein
VASRAVPRFSGPHRLDAPTQNPPILHRDIKSLNFLLTSDLRVKICDFELSRDEGEALQPPDSLHWMAPEVAADESAYTEKSDVYSLGVVLWELFTERLPFDEERFRVVHNGRFAIRAALREGTYRFPFPPQLSPVGAPRRAPRAAPAAHACRRAGAGAAAAGDAGARSGCAPHSAASGGPHGAALPARRRSLSRSALLIYVSSSLEGVCLSFFFFVYYSLRTLTFTVSTCSLS